MPRQSRLDFPGALNHVIGRGIERKFIFKDDSHKTEFHRRLSDSLSHYNGQCFAWCIMGNHFHLLLQTGKTPLHVFMRSLLTGYAVYFNRKNKRSGHLFQNRYKSILCDKDEYLLPLVRYIHLNPVKARILPYHHLAKYSWTGHREISRFENGIINKDEILSFFGLKRRLAIESYNQFIKDGLDIQEDFGGGGLKRSAGGLRNLLNHKKDERELYDERILGNGDFVKEVYDEMDEEDTLSSKVTSKTTLLKKLELHYNLKKDDIFHSRLKNVREARQSYIYLANRYLGDSLTSIGRELGIGRSAVSMVLKRAGDLDLKGINNKFMK